MTKQEEQSEIFKKFEEWFKSEYKTEYNQNSRIHRISKTAFEAGKLPSPDILIPSEEDIDCDLNSSHVCTVCNIANTSERNAAYRFSMFFRDKIKELNNIK